MLSCGGTPRRLTVASAGTRKGRRSIPLPRPFQQESASRLGTENLLGIYPKAYSVT